jgi:SRSO17 transposase
MGRRRQDTSETRFSAYVDRLISVIGHADRARPLRDYCTGLLMPCERKSVEPMAAVTAPERTAAQHQSLLHFVGEGRWSDERVLAEVREMVLPVIERGGPIEAWIIDDTAFPKKGTHSVGVARQYCGQLGKQDNCQVAASLSVANHHASLPVAYRLYLPEAWASNVARRKKVGVPDQIVFQTKIEIARRDAKHRPIKVKDLALRLPAKAWRTITWREGTNVSLKSRFARVRIRIARRDFNRSEPWPEEWLLIEWPKGEKEPTKYWLSSLPPDIGFARFIDLAKLRWRIERDYQELKQETGLDHFEGRGWRGFHHHATLCIAAYGFLISERETIPPSGPGSSTSFKKSPLPRNYRPRGSAAEDRTSHPKLDHNDATAPDRCAHQPPTTMSVLYCAHQKPRAADRLMTQ